jgi:hypothetical protein
MHTIPTPEEFLFSSIKIYCLYGNIAPLAGYQNLRSGRRALFLPVLRIFNVPLSTEAM